jgi:protocadherin-15
MDMLFCNMVLSLFTLQVLQMSVPLDDSDSYNDLQLDFSSKNHAFSLDNVSYITKENGDSIGTRLIT